MSSSYVQPTLPFSEEDPGRSPLRHGQFHYVPVLQERSGERRALEEADADTWARMTPLIVLVGPKDTGTRLTVARLDRAVKRVASVVGEHPIYLDVLRYKADDPVDGAADVLSCVFDRARVRRLSFIPVLPSDSGERHAARIRDAVSVDRLGAALRHRIDHVLPTGVTHASWLEGRFSELGLHHREVDVILDLGWLAADLNVPTAAVAGVVREIQAIGPWRNVVVLGTAMPATLSLVPEGSLGSLPRPEWELWRQLTGPTHSLDVAYGDYAIQHPTPPHEGGGPGMRANIRYTLADRTVIARGEGAIMQGGGAWYPELCRMLAGLEDFSSGRLSWGDAFIEACAEGGEAATGQQLWRGVGTSHHLGFVANNLELLEASVTGS